MIKELNILNYKGLKNVSINTLNSENYPENLVFIYGENGSGKTRMLKFINNMNQLFVRHSLSEEVAGSVTYTDEYNEFNFISSVVDNVWTIELSQLKKDNNVDEEFVSRKIQILKSNLETKEFSINPKFLSTYVDKQLYKEFLQNENLSNVTVAIICLFKSVKNKEFSNKLVSLVKFIIFTNILIDDESSKIDEIIKSYRTLILDKLAYTSSSESNRLDEDFMLTEKQIVKLDEKLNLFSKVINSIDPSIECIFIDRSREEKIVDENGDVYFQNIVLKFRLINGSELLLNSNDISRGIRQLVKIINTVHASTSEENSLALLDEIDPYLQDYLYVELLDAICLTLPVNSQMFIVTHNLFHVDKFSNIKFFTSNNSKGLEVKKIKNFEKIDNDYRRGRILSNTKFENNIYKYLLRNK